MYQMLSVDNLFWNITILWFILEYKLSVSVMSNNIADFDFLMLLRFAEVDTFGYGEI